jgi:hypothetical protein
MYKLSLVDQDIFRLAPRRGNLSLPPLVSNEIMKNLKYVAMYIIKTDHIACITMLGNFNRR